MRAAIIMLALLITTGCALNKQDIDGDGFSANQGDCWDRNYSYYDSQLFGADIYPGALERYYDGVDQNCDGESDYDADRDGQDSIHFGGTDCDDSDPDVFYGALEFCDNVDNDCDGERDNWYAEDAMLLYFDYDGDGFGGDTYTELSCSQSSGFYLIADDCDDGDPDIHPDTDELCDNVDNDCDGEVDEGNDDGPTWYIDYDGDGYGTDTVYNRQSCDPPSGYVDNADDCDNTDYQLNNTDEDLDGFTTCDNDCDDGDPSVYPEAEEIADGVDNDCDGEVDEGVSEGEGEQP